MLKRMLKRFIVWYLLSHCNACFRYGGKVVRVFSQEFYDNEVIEYFNAMARTRINKTEEVANENTKAD